MKKLLSVFLAIVMLFTMATVSFAATNKLELGVKKTVTPVDDDVVALSFKAPARDVYVLKCKLLSGSMVWVDIIYEDEGCINSAQLYKSEDEDFEDCLSSELYFVAEKNTSFEIDVANYWDDEQVSAKSTVELTLSRVNAPALKLGENKVSKDGGVFLFCPSKDGVYSFTSNAKKGVDPHLEITDVYGIPYFSDDNGREEDYNFDFSEYFYKGEIYYVKVDQYVFEDVTASAYNFTVAFEKKQKVESLTLDTYDGKDYLKVYKDYIAEVSLKVVPTGAVYNSGITAATADESIAIAEYFEGSDYVLVGGYKIGKTTLTVSTPDGASCEMTVKVVPSFLRPIDNFFEQVRSFFEMLFLGILGELFS